MAHTLGPRRVGGRDLHSFPFQLNLIVCVQCTWTHSRLFAHGAHVSGPALVRGVELQVALSVVRGVGWGARQGVDRASELGGGKGRGCKTSLVCLTIHQCVMWVILPRATTTG